MVDVLLASATISKKSENDMRFGLIGFGAWGRFHAEAIRKAPGAELAAIACTSEATAAQARERYPDA